MPDKVPRPGEQHPDRWRDDLNPDRMAGANVGAAGPHAELGARTAYDVKSLHRRLRDLPDDLLAQIPVLPEGSRLEQGATYIDLAQDRPREFTATGDMEAGRGACYALKSAVDYTVWNRLIGIDDPARTGAAHRPA